MNKNESEQTSRDVAISVKNLSKKYHLYDSPNHRLREALHPFRKKFHREFWALRDVSFEIKKGECLGIIGKNGSGKSTLLHILCGVLEKSSGEIMVNGKISALLELGTAFNPELTGKENVYMHGAIMGFKKDEMDTRIQAIVEFADIGDFIDQPVKTYSSGMFVRLAFAAAVNVDPDILIIDEALAVGDLKFQKKCKERMNEFRERGITIVLVSHSMYDISTLCDKTIYLQGGRGVFVGDTDEAINIYTYEESKYELSTSRQTVVPPGNQTVLPAHGGGHKGGTSDIIISRLSCYQKGRDKGSSEIEFGENIMIEFEYEALKKIEWPIFRINFSVSGYRFFANIDSPDAGLSMPVIEGKGRILVEVKSPNLYPQAYWVNVAVLTERINSHLFFWRDAAGFVVKPPRERNMKYPTALIELNGSMSVVD